MPEPATPQNGTPDLAQADLLWKSADTQRGYCYDVKLLINGMPVLLVVLKTLGVDSCRAIKQIVDYEDASGNDCTRTLRCFPAIALGMEPNRVAA